MSAKQGRIMECKGNTMKGLKGEKRPADVTGMSVMAARIATDEEETGYEQPNRVKGGRAGGKTRAEKLTAEERKSIARKSARAKKRHC